jgi:serine/threonine-protein kinase HipA
MAQKDIMVFGDWHGLDGPAMIGILHCVPVRGKEVFAFEYDTAWIDSGRYNLLDPDLKLLSGPQYPTAEKNNFGMFLDSSPDRWGRLLLNRREAYLARQESRKAITLQESDYLTGVHDILRMGGLRFKTAESGPFLSHNPVFPIPPLSRLRELEEASLQMERDEAFDDTRFSAWLNLLLAPGSSLGGARPKASVVDNTHHLWIAKFPSRNDLYDTGGWEMVVWELARRCGLSVPESKVAMYSGKGHTFLTRRFDRTLSGERIHFASAMTLLGYTDGTDFRDGASYLELAEFIMQHGAEVDRDLEELWRRILFTICISNTDDHLRNHGMLLTEAGWRLSPAYDLNPNPSGTGLTLNISLTDNSLEPDLAMEVRSFFRINDRKAREIFINIKKEVRNWRRLAEKLNIPKHEQELLSPAFLT